MDQTKKTKDGFIDVKIEQLIEWDEPDGDGCMVSDKVTKEGSKIGYMYREQPDEGMPDSGWRFLAGDESDEYLSNPDNIHVFALNTVCNYDKAIIPYLHSSTGSKFIRVGDKFEPDDGAKVTKSETEF